MKALPILLLAAVVAGLLSLLWVQGAGDAVPASLPHQGVVPASPDSGGAEGTGIDPAMELPRPEASGSRSAADALASSTFPPETTVSAAFDGPWTRVEGRVVDQEGTPLVGARVQLRVYRGPEGADLAELEPLGNETYTRRSSGVEALTDASGQFGVDAPFGPETLYSLEVAGDRFHDSATIRFGRDGTQPVIEGLVDVGEIRLATTGSIFGTVSDVRGQPIIGAAMDTGPDRSTTFSRGSISGEDGTFVIPHATVGTYMVKAKIEGSLSKQVADVTVKAGEDSGPIDIVLEDAPRIEGRIVDEAGAPIEGVRLHGWPKSSGSGAGAKTKVDGSFVIYLPQEEPYTLQATHPDYEQWGDEGDRDTRFEPGTSLGTITLMKVPQVTFTVADRANDEPLSAYGLLIARNEGSEATSGGTTFHHLPAVKDHPEGVLAAGATPRRDGYVAYAPGFLMQEGDVEPTEESVAAGAPAQRILLDRGAGVEGRLMADGEPVAGAPIEFTPGSPYRTGYSPQERLAFQIQSGPDGRFKTTGLPTHGKVRLMATRPGGGAPLVQMLEKLESGKVEDLGDLEFLEGGIVIGHVLLPEGIEPGGITIYRGDWKEDVNQVTDSAGVFRFEDVPVGENSFGQRGRPEILDAGGQVKAIVEPGEVTEVTLDLRDQVLVDIEIQIDLGARSAAGLRVSLVVPASEGQEPLFALDSREHIQLGTTDDGGVVRSHCRAAQGARVEVRLPHGQALLHDGEPLNVSFGPPFVERVSFKMSSLVVDLSTSGAIPPDGTLCMDLARPDGAPFANKFIRVSLEDGEVQTELADWAKLAGSQWTVHGVEEGDWNVTVYASRKDAPRVETQLASGATRYSAEREFEFSSRVTLHAGETTRLESAPR